MYQVVFELLYSKFSWELSYSIFRLFDLILPHGFKCKYWHLGRFQKFTGPDPYMSLNHLTGGYFCSFSCIVSCAVIRTFHSLKDHLRKYLMSLIMPLMSPTWTLQPHHGLGSVQFSSAWSCCSFPQFLWGRALLLPLLGGSWLILGCAVDHQWIHYQSSMFSAVGLCLSVRPWMVGCDLLLLNPCCEEARPVSFWWWAWFPIWFPPGRWWDCCYLDAGQ